MKYRRVETKTGHNILDENEKSKNSNKEKETGRVIITAAKMSVVTKTEKIRWKGIQQNKKKKIQDKLQMINMKQEF